MNRPRSFNTTYAILAVFVTVLMGVLLSSAGLKISNWQYFPVLLLATVQGMLFNAALAGTQEEDRPAIAEPQLEEPVGLVAAVQAAQQNPKKRKTSRR